MATKKFSELTVLDTVNANLVLTVIPVYDTSSGTTRKVTLQQINDSIEANIPFAAAAFTQANTPSHVANSASSYANAAFLKANTATTDAANSDSKAVSAGSYANSAFGVANSASSYVNSAYGQANTATTNAANSDSKSVSAGSYANSAFVTANNITSNYLTLSGAGLAVVNQTYIKTSPTLYTGSSGVTVEDFGGTWFCIQDGDAKYTSTNLITWSNSTGGLPTPTGTVITSILTVIGDIANSASSYANSAYGQANTANTLAQAAFDAANNVNVSGNTGNVTFSNQVVQGTGDEYGGGGLYLAPGPNSTGNLQYLRVRGGDYPTHIHFDTGNNSYYDQYFGDDNKYVLLSNTGNIVINTNDYAGNTAQWNFGTDSKLTLPDSGFIQSYPGTGNSEWTAGPVPGSYVSLASNNSNSYIWVDNDGVYIATNWNSGAKQWTFGTDGNLTFPDSSTQNTAYTGLSKFSTVTTSTHTFNELTEEILFCDPNSAASPISIYLPDSMANGKSFTVKNINAGGNVVYVQVQTGTTPLEIETGSVGTFNYANIANTGSSITWLFDGTTYRIINEVIR